MCAVTELYDRIVDKSLLVRRMYVVANHVLPEADAPQKNGGAVQLDLFTDYAAEAEKQKAEDAALERESGSTGGYPCHQEEIRKERHPQGDEP